MRVVNIAELKNRLSTYLNFARAGEEVIIRDRNRPVARLVPFVAVNATEEELQLVAEGKMKLRERDFNLEEFNKLPTTRMMGTSVTQAVLDEREEGW